MAKSATPIAPEVAIVVEAKNPKLEALASKIKQSEKGYCKTLRQGLEHAKQCGELLSQAKEICQNSTPKMDWKLWVPKNTNMTKQNADAYIRIHDNWEKVAAAADAAEANGKKFTIADALRTIAGTPTDDDKDKKGKGKGKPITLSKKKLQDAIASFDASMSAVKIVFVLQQAGLQLVLEEEKPPEVPTTTTS